MPDQHESVPTPEHYALAWNLVGSLSLCTSEQIMKKAEVMFEWYIL